MAPAHGEFTHRHVGDLGQFKCESEDNWSLPEAIKTQPILLDPFASSTPASASRPLHCLDNVCCREIPQQSFAMCKPLLGPDEDCMKSCSSEKWSWYSHWMRATGMPEWLLCCEEKRAPDTQKAINLRNLMLDASLANAEREGGMCDAASSQKRAATSRSQVILVQEPAIALPGPAGMSTPHVGPSWTGASYVPEVGELQVLEEEREREYTEVELETETGKYRGQWWGKQKHGEGVLAFSDGRLYQGQFKHDLAAGHGRLTLQNGALLECNWVQGKADGFGRYSHRGNSYEGQWRNDEKSGKGTETWPDGSAYSGDFCFNLRHGTGTYKTGAGAMYEGHFAEDRMHGSGKYTFADGHTYEGEWVRGHQCGHGRIAWPNGFKYEGSFKDDKKEGRGTATWPDGRSYAGEWSRGLQHGIGITTTPNGVQQERRWHQGKAVPARGPGSPRPAHDSFVAGRPIGNSNAWTPGWSS